MTLKTDQEAADMIVDLIESGHDYGRGEERAAIVAWLRWGGENEDVLAVSQMDDVEVVSLRRSGPSRN